jgi:hypothetical protein
MMVFSLLLPQHLQEAVQVLKADEEAVFAEGLNAEDLRRQVCVCRCYVLCSTFVMSELQNVLECQNFSNVPKVLNLSDPSLQTPSHPPSFAPIFRLQPSIVGVGNVYILSFWTSFKNVCVYYSSVRDQFRENAWSSGRSIKVLRQSFSWCR